MVRLIRRTRWRASWGLKNREILYREGDPIAEPDYCGAGWDWESVTGFSDEDTIKRLRGVQRMLIGLARLQP